MFIYVGIQSTLQSWLRVISALIVASTLSGCSSISSTQLYQNHQMGIVLEHPNNWKIETNPRVDNHIILQSKNVLFERNSSRIEIFVNPLNKSPFDMIEKLDASIISLTRSHELDSFIVVKQPTIHYGRDPDMASATISIPTASLPEDSSKNQMGVRSQDITQILEIFLLKNIDRRYMLVEIYRGKSEELNAQAEAIVNSIRFIPPSLP